MAFTSVGEEFDRDLYGREEYDTSIATTDEDVEAEASIEEQRRLPSYTAPSRVHDEVLREGGGDDDDVFKETRAPRIADRESSYQAQRRNRKLSPERADPFAEKVRHRLDCDCDQ